MLMNFVLYFSRKCTTRFNGHLYGGQSTEGGGVCLGVCVCPGGESAYEGVCVRAVCVSKGDVHPAAHRVLG